MFNLEQAIDQWCANAVAKGAWPQSEIDELRDHVFCAVEALVEKGLGQEEAFLLATQQLTDVPGDNTPASPLGKVCAALRKLEGIDDNEPSSLVRLRIGNAIIWASMMIITSILVGDHDNAGSLLMLQIIGWLATSMSLTNKKLKIPLRP